MNDGCKAGTPLIHITLCICIEILCGSSNICASSCCVGEDRVISFLAAEYPQQGKSMSYQTPMSELAERILSKAVREASHAATLDQHLRSQNCVTAPVLASILGCSADTIHRRRRTQGLPAHFDGGRWKFYGPEVAAWQANRDYQHGHAEKQGISCRQSARSTEGSK